VAEAGQGGVPPEEIAPLAAGGAAEREQAVPPGRLALELDEPELRGRLRSEHRLSFELALSRGISPARLRVKRISAARWDSRAQGDEPAPPKTVSHALLPRRSRVKISYGFAGA